MQTDPEFTPCDKGHGRRSIYALALALCLSAAATHPATSEPVIIAPDPYAYGGAAGSGYERSAGPFWSHQADRYGSRTERYLAAPDEYDPYGDGSRYDPYDDTYSESPYNEDSYVVDRYGRRYAVEPDGAGRYVLQPYRGDGYGRQRYRLRQYDTSTIWRQRDPYRAWDGDQRAGRDDRTNERALSARPYYADPWSGEQSFAEESQDGPATEPLPEHVPVLGVQAADPNSRFGDSLAQALAHYRDIAAAGGWGTVPDGPALKPGMRDPRIPALRRRLAITGDLPRAYVQGSTYDSGLEIAVKRFQERHGLAVDGVAGPATVAAMNVPVERRIAQIAFNIERWREQAPELGERYVLVNIPAFQLEVIEGGQTNLRMAVIAGEPEHPTPVFSDRIEYVEFSPYWNVPKSITRDELVYQFAENPAAAEGFEVLYQGDIYDAQRIDWAVYQGKEVPFTVRQTPGPRNALGQVKFMLPNRYNVYLHDTPAQHLFARASRAFSHGCVRVADPRAFAQYLLAGKTDWSDTRIDAALEGSENLQVPLESFVPVHFIYMTAWVDSQGGVQFREDIYNKDELGAVTAMNQ